MINSYIHLAILVSVISYFHINTLGPNYRNNIFNYIGSFIAALIVTIGAVISSVSAMYANTYISTISWFIVAVLWCPISFNAFQRLKYYYFERKNKNNHDKKDSL